MSAGDDFQREAHIGDSPRHGALGVHQLNGHQIVLRGNETRVGHTAEGRANGGDAAGVGGIAQRAADVIAEPDRRHAVASATASPPLEPPAVRAGFHGFRVSPCRELSVWTRSAMSGRFVRPIGIAPAARIRSTTGGSKGATAFANALTPQVVAVPAKSMFSLIVNGTPCNGPSRSPAAILRSASAACFLASSARTLTIAFTFGLTASIRRRCDSATSAHDACFLAISAANSEPEGCQRYAMVRSSLSAAPGATDPGKVSRVPTRRHHELPRVGLRPPQLGATPWTST